jgi:hypothetical protein
MYFFLENWRFTKFFSGNCFIFWQWQWRMFYFWQWSRNRYWLMLKEGTCSVGSVVAKNPLLYRGATQLVSSSRGAVQILHSEEEEEEPYLL